MQFKVPSEVLEAFKAEADRRHLPMAILVRALLRQAMAEGFKISL
jgi:hypothetical protein